MSFALTRDGNNKIIKSSTTISTVPTINNSKSIGSTGISDIASVTTVNFNGTNLTANSDQLNYLKVTPGIASASKAVVVDTNRSVTGINALSSTNLVVNGTNITASLYANTTSDDLNSPYLDSITAGTAQASKALVPNALLDISNLNNITSKAITLNNAVVSSPALTKNLNLNSFYNKRLISSSALSSLLSNSTSSWNQITTHNTAIDSIYWNSICWSPELGLFVAVANGAMSSYTTTNNRVMTSTDGYVWSIRSSAADNNWNSVCWSSALMLFVAVSSSGSGNRVMTSSDGINWTSRTSAVDNSWQNICWSPELSLFVAVANSGNGNRVMTSPDGINWTLRITPDNLSSWNSICWSPELNLFVAVASSGTNRIMISSNGINWTAVSEPNGIVGTWYSVCWSPELGLFVAVANSATNNRNFIRSSDGINWISSYEINGMSCQLITWSRDLEMFIAMNQNGQYFSYSYDAISWTRVLITSSSNVPRPGSIIWSSEYKMFIVVSNYNGSGNTSGERIWNTFPCAIGSKGGLLTETFNISIDQSNNYVGINTNDPGRPLEINSVTGNCLKISYPTDASKFVSLDVLSTGQFNINTQRFFNINTNYLTYGLLLNNDIVKTTVTEFNTYLPNITNGVAQTSKVAVLNSSYDITGINSINCNSLTVNGSNIDYSSNNEYFQNISSGTTTAYKALLVNNLNNISGINNIGTNQLILNNSSINSNGSQSINVNTIINKTKYSNGDISKAMNTWTARATSNNQYYSSCWSPELGIFVAVSIDGTNRVATSTNGVVWTDVVSTVAAGSAWYSICWSPELRLFVAVGGGTNGIMTSTDGTNWITRTTPQTSTAWTSICWSPELGLFVVVANSNTYRSMISYDGINWYKTSMPSSISWSCVCWANTLGLFIAVASDSSISTNIATSPDGINWTTRTNPSLQNFNAVCWSQELGMLITANGGNSFHLYSRDGINWYINKVSSNAIWWFCGWISDLGIFILLSSNTVNIIYSFDGLNWNNTSITGVTPFFSSIIWSSELNMLVASSHSGTASYKIYTSDIFTPNSKSCILSNSSDFTINNTNGRVGIGMSSPSYQLQLSTDSASKASTSTWTVSSDLRLKENIQDADLDLCYNNVKNLRLARYKWKDEVYTTEQVPDRSKLGWIAQEVETIFPKSVQKINDHGFTDCRTLNTDQIIASLYGCSQKLIKKYEDDDEIFNSIREKLNEIQIFIDNIPEE